MWYNRVIGVDNFMSTFNKQLKNHSKTVRRGIVKQMRKDLIYLIKPRPKFWPKFIWLRILKKCLNLKPGQIKIKQDEII